MAQNLVFPDDDNKVRQVYTGIDLTQALNIQVQLNDESYDLATNPDVVIVEDATTLAINLNGTQVKGRVYLTVKYIDAVKTVRISSREQDTGPVVIAIGSQLTVEDGSIVDSANSLVTDDEFKQYADIRFVDIPGTQPERESLLVKAMDYLFSVEHKLQGTRTSATQDLPFPRIGVHGRNMHISSSTIHPDWKKAQMELAIQAYSGELLESGSVQNVASEKLDTMEVSYFENGKNTKSFEKAEAYLKPYYQNGGSLRLVRK